MVGVKEEIGRTITPYVLAPDSPNLRMLAACVNEDQKRRYLEPYVRGETISAIGISEPGAGADPAAMATRAVKQGDDYIINGSKIWITRAAEADFTILMAVTDPEARAIPDPNQAGKVKEPALLMLGLVRAIGGTSDGYAMTTRGAGMGQPVFHAPSVFGFYPPDYPLPLGAPLLSPASKLMTTATVIARHNLTYDWTLGGDARPEFSPQPTIAGSTGTQLDWAAWQAYGTDVDGQLDRINLLMLEGGLTAAQRTAIRTAMLAVTNADPATQARRRAQTALYIAASSPLFQIDR